MRNRTGSPCILLIPALLLLPALAAAAEHCDPRSLLRKVVSEQGRRPDHARGYTRDRDLLEYLRSFPPEVGEKIAKLDGKGLILDAGAGEAIAAEQTLQTRLEGLLLDEADQMKLHKVVIQQSADASKFIHAISRKPMKDRPTMIALSKEMDRTLDTTPYQGKLKLLTGHFLEDLPASALGRPDLILEYIGVMSYSADPTTVLKKYLETLKPDGDIYLLFDRSLREQGERTWTSTHSGRSIVEEGISKNIDFYEWLKALDGKGIRVRELENLKRVYHSKEGRTHYFDYRYHTLHIRKTGGHISIPKLKLVDAMTDENPPRRFFRVVDGHESTF